ncbi:MAG: RsmD family RNA methyltransferase [Burkholderiaceae bacterium]
MSRARSPGGLSCKAALPHEVRIVGGRWKRSVLPVRDAPGLRPTPQRVREQLFNWLGQDLTGWRCLDAFAGSGALGFEAGSRGAAEVVLLEREPALVASLRATQARLGASHLRIERAETLAWMRQAAPQSFDLVLLDPPFDAPWRAEAIAAAAPLVRVSGYLYVEGPVALAEPPPGFELWRHDRAGAVHVQVLRRNS